MKGPHERRAQLRPTVPPPSTHVADTNTRTDRQTDRQTYRQASGQTDAKRTRSARRAPKPRGQNIEYTPRAE